MASLTRRQKDILDFLTAYRESEGLFPTLREIGEHFGISSFGTIHKHLHQLEQKGFIRRERHSSRAIEIEDEAAPAADQLPLLGWIAAGRPLEAISEPEAITVPRHLQAASDEHFVLRVTGTSMIDEGIFDGDLVVVQRRSAARTGDMVVAVIEGEATLKRFFLEGTAVRLQPSNREMEPIVVPAAAVEIQGVVAGLMRKY